MHNSLIASSTFSVLCSHYHYPFPDVFHHPCIKSTLLSIREIVVVFFLSFLGLVSPVFQQPSIHCDLLVLTEKLVILIRMVPFDLYLFHVSEYLLKLYHLSFYCHFIFVCSFWSNEIDTHEV